MATAAPEAKIDIGRAIGRAFEALRANFLPFFALSLLLSGVPAFATQYWLLSVANGRDPAVIASPSYWGVLLGGILLGFVTGALLQGVLVRSTILYLSGREPDFGQSVALGLRLVLPIIGVSIVVGFIVGVGLILLIVPGVIAYCAFSVAVPALVEERRGVFGSMQRSRDLTRGSRGRVFLLLLVYFVFSIIISALLGAIGGVANFDGPTPSLADPLTNGVANALGTSLSAVILAVFLAALYIELRTVKEGASTDDLAAIFD